MLNVVMDEEQRIAGAVAGHPRHARRAGCQTLDVFGQAVAAAQAALPPNPCIVVMPEGGSVLPTVRR